MREDQYDAGAMLIEASHAPLPLRHTAVATHKPIMLPPKTHTHTHTHSPDAAPTSCTALVGRSCPHLHPACHSSSPARDMRESTSPWQGHTS